MKVHHGIRFFVVVMAITFIVLIFAALNMTKPTCAAAPNTTPSTCNMPTATPKPPQPTTSGSGGAPTSAGPQATNTSGSPNVTRVPPPGSTSASGTTPTSVAVHPTNTSTSPNLTRVPQPTHTSAPVGNTSVPSTAVPTAVPTNSSSGGSTGGTPGNGGGGATSVPTAIPTSSSNGGTTGNGGNGGGGTSNTSNNQPCVPTGTNGTGGTNNSGNTSGTGGSMTGNCNNNASNQPCVTNGTSGTNTTTGTNGTTNGANGSSTGNTMTGNCNTTRPVAGTGATCPDWLVYHTNQTGNWEIFRLGNIPGKPNANANLTQSVGYTKVDNVAPSLSPDRSKIAFASNREGNWGIYVAATDGTSVQRLTHNTLDVDPVWSPDGTRLVYETARNGNWQLMLLSVASGTEIALTDGTTAATNAYFAADGKSILYDGVENDLSQIFRLDIATHQSVRLSDGQGNDFNPAYSPNNKQIAFYSYRGSQTSTLYVMNSDGSHLTAISDSAGSALNQSWSPDGSLIAYEFRQNGAASVYVYQLATGKTRQVTDAQSVDYAPTWYCNSTTLVFTSTVTGSPNLFSTNALPMNAKPIRVDKQAIQLTHVNGAAAQFAEDVPHEEDASNLGPPSASVVLPFLGGGNSCGKSSRADSSGNGLGFPVISIDACAPSNSQ